MDKLTKNPFLNYIRTDFNDATELEGIKQLALSGELLVNIGFKKYEGDNPRVKSFLAEDDLGSYYIIEKDEVLYVISRRGNDWFTFEGLFDEYYKD